MKITCVGGGPAGLLLAILTGGAGHDVTVIERQSPAESFGWGVVFWDNLLRELDRHDPPTAALVREHAYTWHDQVVVIDDAEPVTIPSYGYSMRRRLLLELLRGRAAEVGVRIEERQFTGSSADLAEADLVVASDGVNSRLRGEQPGFGTRLDRRRNYYLWLGTEREFDSFTFPFVRRPEGWLWAHAYGFDSGASTFVLELAPETWQALGFDRLGPDESLRMLEEFFADSLDGHRLHPQAGTRDRLPWTNFVVVHNRHWHVGNLVLLGDAAHTTHFTIGSGTRLAIEDSIALAESLAAESSSGRGPRPLRAGPAGGHADRAARGDPQCALVRAGAALYRPAAADLRETDGRPPLPRDAAAAGAALSGAVRGGRAYPADRRRRCAGWSAGSEFATRLVCDSLVDFDLRLRVFFDRSRPGTGAGPPRVRGATGVRDGSRPPRSAAATGRADEPAAARASGRAVAPVPPDRVDRAPARRPRRSTRGAARPTDCPGRRP